MIRFNKPAFTGEELEYITDAINIGRLSGDNKYTRLCQEWFENEFSVKKALLTPSGTASLEMTALLSNINPGDEVIMPSFTFVSTANAYLLRGARIKFIDIRPDTLNMDENLVADAITDKTKAVVPVHYAGVPCEMDKINEVCRDRGIVVIEDAAQALMSEYKGRPAGTLGHFGAFSFHETKNYNCGEGGVIYVNEEEFVTRSEIIREKGTNRSQFFRGEVDKYTWVDIGSSYLLSELGAAFLYAQLIHADKITADRMKTWNKYYAALKPLADDGQLELTSIPADCTHNGHLFYILANDHEQQAALLAHLKADEINAVFHYVPLHSSPMGEKVSEFHGEDRYTTELSKRLIRLPLYYELAEEKSDAVIKSIYKFYESIT